MDIILDFKCRAIDTPGVIERIAELFSGNTVFLEGFNAFLPPGYKMVCDQSEVVYVEGPNHTVIAAPDKRFVIGDITYHRPGGAQAELRQSESSDDTSSMDYMWCD